MPWPKASFHSRLTNTRATSGLSGETSQRARSSRVARRSPVSQRRQKAGHARQHDLARFVQPVAARQHAHRARLDRHRDQRRAARLDRIRRWRCSGSGQLLRDRLPTAARSSDSRRPASCCCSAVRESAAMARIVEQSSGRQPVVARTGCGAVVAERRKRPRLCAGRDSAASSIVSVEPLGRRRCVSARLEHGRAFSRPTCGQHGPAGRRWRCRRWPRRRGTALARNRPERAARTRPRRLAPTGCDCRRPTVGSRFRESTKLPLPRGPALCRQRFVRQRFQPQRRDARQVDGTRTAYRCPSRPVRAR